MFFAFEVGVFLVEITTVSSRYKIAGNKIVLDMSCVSRSSRGVNVKIWEDLAKSPPIL